MVCRSLILIAFATGLSAETAAISLAYGKVYPTSGSARDAVDEDGSWEWIEDGGFNVVLGLSAPEQSFFGYPWIDFDWSRVEGNGNRFDTLGILYTERMPIWRGWIGAGLGSTYLNARVDDGTRIRRNDRWALGLKACVGLSLTPTIFVEASWLYADDIFGVDADRYALTAGFRF